MYGPLPTLEGVQEARGGWDRLGLYMKGVPSKVVEDKSRDSPQNQSLEDLNISASSVMLSLKADQDSFDKRFEIQERQYNILTSGLAEEM